MSNQILCCVNCTIELVCSKKRYLFPIIPQVENGINGSKKKQKSKV